MDLELKKVTNNKLEEVSKKVEKEHVMLEGTLIRMVTDSQKHNKKLKTEIDELKCKIQFYKRSQKIKDNIKNENNGICKELCPHCPNSTKVYTNFHNLWTHITAKHKGKELIN